MKNCIAQIPMEKESNILFSKSFDVRKFIKENKVLVLTVKWQWFDVMVTGEKTSEFRKPTKFIKDRLYDKNGNAKHYDYVLIVNGYGYHLPYFIAKYEGFGTNYDNHYKFSNGMEIYLNPKDFNIFLGEIIYKANIKPIDKPKK